MKKLFNLSENQSQQLDRIVEIWKEHINDDLAGIYIHGIVHIALFDCSSIALLVLVKNAIEYSKKISIAKDLSEIDNCPMQLTILAMNIHEEKGKKTLGHCVFHYSNYFGPIEKYLPDRYYYNHTVRVIDTSTTTYSPLSDDGTGEILCGEETKELFPDMSDTDCWNAICTEIEHHILCSYPAKDYAERIFFLGKLLLLDHPNRGSSKYDIGIWMAEYVPEVFKHSVESIMQISFGGNEFDFSQNDLEKLCVFLQDEIKKDGSIKA